LADLLPEFREAAKVDAPVNKTVPTLASENHEDIAPVSENITSTISTQHDVDMVVPQGEDIVYYVPSESEYKEGLQVAKQIYINRGIDVSAHPFWNRLDSDPDYQGEIVQELKNKMENAIQLNAELNENN
jgi:hypothetical protein